MCVRADHIRLLASQRAPGVYPPPPVQEPREHAAQVPRHQIVARYRPRGAGTGRIAASVPGGRGGIQRIAAVFGGPLIVIENLGPIAALKRSIRTVNQHFFAYAGLFLLLGILMILSAIPFGLGLLWTLPLYFNAYGAVYRKAFGVDTSRLEAIRVWK